jgi:hypothetical protein
MTNRVNYKLPGHAGCPFANYAPPFKSPVLGMADLWKQRRREFSEKFHRSVGTKLDPSYVKP